MNYMSVVEDVRQVLQDFLAPELRAVAVRIDALEKVMNARFEANDVKLESIQKEIQTLTKSLDIDRRLAALEAKQVA